MPPAEHVERPVSLDDVRRGLEQVLSTYSGGPPQVVALERRPSIYRSSFALDELDVALADGTRHELIFKDTSRLALSEGARRAKPPFLYQPTREIETYRTLLAPNGLGPTYYGAVVDPDQDRYWLFLERVPGRPLCEVGDFEVWKRVAAWLATLHERFPGETIAQDRRLAATTVRYDAAFYWQWLRRARAFAPPNSPSAHRLLGWLQASYSAVVARLLDLPRSLLHGDFYASNVLVDPGDDTPRICPVDWELAAVGPGLVDLAALVAGSWDDEARDELALVYRDALMPRAGWPPDAATFLRALDYCRLHLAVQWLGWSRDWSPPMEHAHDWLDDVRRLADKLGL